MSSALKEELLLADASDDFVRPVFEIPYRLDIDLTNFGADDRDPWNRQPVNRASPAR